MRNVKTKSFHARVTEEKHRELSAIAEAQNRTISEIVREQIEEYIRLWETRKGNDK